MEEKDTAARGNRAAHGHEGKLRSRIFLVVLAGLVPAIVIAALGFYAVTDAHRDDVARLESFHT